MKEVNMQNFENEVINSEIPVLVDFWAAWCGPCRALAPTLEQLDKEMAGAVKIVKVNVDESPDLAMAFGVSSIPTLIVFKNGQIASKSVGLQPLSAIKAML